MRAEVAQLARFSYVALLVRKNPQFLAGTNVPMRSFSPAIASIEMGPLPYNQEREEVCFYHSFSIVFSNFT